MCTAVAMFAQQVDAAGTHAPPEQVGARQVFLCGVRVRDELVLELARLVDDDGLAGRLENAYGREVKVLGPTVPEREHIIRALVDPPPGLEELRGVLLPNTSDASARGWFERQLGAVRTPRDSGLRPPRPQGSAGGHTCRSGTGDGASK
jgi:hypothetical protein